MSFDSFWHLHSILLPHILTVTKRTCRYKKKGGRYGGIHSLPPVYNGPITLSVWLGAALRYFAGGLHHDIMCVFCISLSEVLKSMWIVVDAVNDCPQFHISYPSSLEKQQRIATEFEATSTPKFRNCAGAIDGILIWTQKPSLNEAKSVGVAQKKFLCGRMHKFGLNCQAISDSRGRILDISIKCGGASFDCLAFKASELHQWPHAARCWQQKVCIIWRQCLLEHVIHGDTLYKCFWRCKSSCQGQLQFLPLTASYSGRVFL